MTRTLPASPSGLQTNSLTPARLDEVKPLLGQAEARLIGIYQLISQGQHRDALALADQLVKDHPNFQLAHLVHGDLLSLQARPVRQLGDVPDTKALAASQQLVIPVQTEFLAVKGLERMVGTLAMVNRSRKQALPYQIVPTLFDRRTQASLGTLKLLRDTYEQNVWQGYIPVDTRLRDASRKGVTPSQFDGKSRGLIAYRALLKHLLTYKTAVQVA